MPLRAAGGADRHGALFVCDDLGDPWQEVSDNYALNVRGFRVTTLADDPCDAHTAYFGGNVPLESTGGGLHGQTIGPI